MDVPRAHSRIVGASPGENIAAARDRFSKGRTSTFSRSGSLDRSAHLSLSHNIYLYTLINDHDLSGSLLPATKVIANFFVFYSRLFVVHFRYWGILVRVVYKKCELADFIGSVDFQESPEIHFGQLTSASRKMTIIRRWHCFKHARCQVSKVSHFEHVL